MNVSLSLSSAINRSTCLCFRYDYLTIKNERKDSFAFLCGEQPGKEVTVIGEYALLTFSSDVEIQARGFNLVFTFLGE